MLNECYPTRAYNFRRIDLVRTKMKIKIKIVHVLRNSISIQGNQICFILNWSRKLKIEVIFEPFGFGCAEKLAVTTAINSTLPVTVCIGNTQWQYQIKPLKSLSNVLNTL